MGEGPNPVVPCGISNLPFCGAFTLPAARLRAWTFVTLARRYSAA
jgi:hypothetical protein